MTGAERTALVVLRAKVLVTPRTVMSGKTAGTSVLELLVAMGVMLTVTASVFALLDAGRGNFVAQAERADVQQRMRVAADTLFKDLLVAGAGPSQGAGHGPLVNAIAPVVPFRRGSSADDPPGAFRSDTITVFSVPSTAAQTTLASAASVGSTADVAVKPDPGCPIGDPACGFKAGQHVLLYDLTGAYDTFVVNDVDGSTLHLQHNGSRLTSASYAPDTTTIVQVVVASYALNIDAAAGTYQLTTFDGGLGGDAPVADHVVSLAFAYYGDAQPPRLTGTALDDPVGPWTTYGPAPPRAGRQLPSGGYPPGENCTFLLDASTGRPVPRLDILGSGGPDLVSLGRDQLTDGPWCPDPQSPNRWDADLLRIRRIAVTVRVQSANPAFRGPAGPLFRIAGTSRLAGLWVPDREITFDVAPRNLNLAR